MTRQLRRLQLPQRLQRELTYTTIGVLEVSPSRGDLAFHAFMGHLDFGCRLLGLIDGPGLQADDHQNKDLEHQL